MRVFIAVLLGLLVATSSRATDVRPGPLENLAEDAHWVGLARVLGSEPVTYTFGNEETACGHRYTVEPRETLWGSGGRSVFFALGEAPPAGSVVVAVLSTWTPRMEKLRRGVLANPPVKGRAWEEMRCKLAEGIQEERASVVLMLDENAAKAFGGTWVRSLTGSEYWSRGDRERRAGVPEGVFSWEGVRARLFEALESCCRRPLPAEPAPSTSAARPGG